MSLFTWKTSYNMNKRYVEKFQFFVLKFFKNLWKEFKFDKTSIREFFSRY